jgi:hypothetical protein
MSGTPSLSYSDCPLRGDAEQVKNEIGRRSVILLLLGVLLSSTLVLAQQVSGLQQTIRLQRD